MDMITRNDIFQAVRWFNLIIGMANFYYYFIGASFFLLPLGALNMAAWAFTLGRKVEESEKK